MSQEMTTLCISPPPGIACDLLLSVFVRAGMEHLSNGDEGKIDSIESWQQHILQGNPDSTHPLKIGAFWQKVITDLYLTMLDRPFWGWGLNGDGRFLDFWGEFDPSIRFVLFTTPPEFLLSHLLERHPALFCEKTISEWIDAWTSYHQQVLAFHLRHPDQSVLLDLEAFLKTPNEAIDHLAEHWSLGLLKTGLASPENCLPSPLAHFLIAKTLHKQAKIDSIIREINDCRLVFQTQNELFPGFENTSLVTDAYIALHTQAKLTQEQQHSLNILSTERDQLSREKEEALKESELLLLQLHKIQEQLEQYYSLKQELAKLEQERNNQNKLSQEHKIHLNQLNAKRDQLAKEKEEAMKESELLLLQLHQVQEELEHYFLRHQEAQQAVDHWKTRWARMLERNPDFLDYEHLIVVAEPNTNQIRWRFENIDIASRSIPVLEFRTLLEGSMGGLVFERERASGVLTRWPNVAGMEESLELILAGDGKVGEARFQALQALAPSDLALVRTLAHILATSGFSTEEALEVLDEEARSALSLGLKRFYEAFDQLPPTFRYDRIELKREQVNPAYEHLWFRFDHAGFGDILADTFEFRISCADVRLNAFGEHPKLEFPKGEGASLFEKWYEESWDDFSSKWELRFALPPAMDAVVWNSVSDRDRALVCAVVDRIPAMFEEVAAQAFTPKRGWGDWKTLASTVIRILALNTQAG